MIYDYDEVHKNHTPGSSCSSLYFADDFTDEVPVLCHLETPVPLLFCSFTTIVLSFHQRFTQLVHMFRLQEIQIGCT